jgi:hypothetical protein
MIDIRVESPPADEASGRTASVPVEQAARSDERRLIGRQLHQGILQELTVAGFRLKAMQSAAPETAAAAIGEFAEWLRARQAELRHYVARLEDGLSDEPIELTAIAAELAACDCRVSFDERLRPARFAPQPWEGIIASLDGVTRLLSDSRGADAIDVGLAGDALPVLNINHDGKRPGDHAEALAALRALAGACGASLRIEADGHSLILAWAD